jgi:hypothetical protein
MHDGMLSTRIRYQADSIKTARKSLFFASVCVLQSIPFPKGSHSRRVTNKRPVISIGWRPLLQDRPGCRTTHCNNLCPLGSSRACFSTPRMRLAFSRRHNQPSQRLRRCPGLRKTSVGKPCAGRRGRGTHSLSPSVPSHKLLTHTF